MGELIPRPGMKLMWMIPGDHRIYCDEKHRPASALGPYQEQFAESANCWMCLREIDTPFKMPNREKKAA